MQTVSQTNIQYMADIENVKEVVLSGSADLGYWQKALTSVKLAPVSRDGKAQMQISVTDMKYMGRRFNEFTISVLVAPANDNAAPSGFYLVHAYNTSAFFALMERAFFATPYYHADIDLKETVPVAFALRDGSGVVLSAMFSSSAAPRKFDDTLEVPIYLPSRTGHDRGAKMFYASLGGEMAVYPFSPSDTFRVQSPQPHHALQMLVDSHFTPSEWRVRPNGTHRKSKTYNR